MAIIEKEFMVLTEDLDVDAFWEENALCQEFTTDKPRCSMSLSPDDHWIFEFVNVPSTLRYYHDKDYSDKLHKHVNEVTQLYAGKAFFEEQTWEHNPKRIENLFGCDFSYHEGSTPWLTPVTENPEEFAEVLDIAEGTKLESWSLPANFVLEWNHRSSLGLEMPELGTGSRGPATIITSILRAETALLWMYDYPDLMHRFSEILAEKMVEFNRILRTFSGVQADGWWITDDNCALFNRKLYKEYCYPVLHQVMAALAPGDAPRYQHSDSAMGHLLDQQYALGIRSVNYGPEVDVSLIRQMMPDAVINGQIPPMILRNGSPVDIKQRIISDFEKAGRTGGLNITTAGSLAAGTGVGRMRWMMKVVQDHCRYNEEISNE